MFPRASIAKAQAIVIIALEKVSRAKKARSDFKRAFRAEVPGAAKFARDYLELMRAEIESNLSKMRKTTPAKMVDKLADWDELRAVGEIMLKELTLELLTAGGQSAFKQFLRKQDRFDPLHAEATKFAQVHAALSITDRHALAVGRTLTRLLDAGVPTDKALKIAQRQANKLLRLRVNTIARTETATSLNEGLIQGYGQLGVKKLQRIEDGDSPDEPCQSGNGRIYTIAEASGVLPEHQNCEGSFVAA